MKLFSVETSIDENGELSADDMNVSSVGCFVIVVAIGLCMAVLISIPLVAVLWILSLF